MLRAGHRGHPDARARALTPLLRLPALRAPLPLVRDLVWRSDVAKYPPRKIVLELYVLGDAQGRRAHARRAHARANAAAALAGLARAPLLDALDEQIHHPSTLVVRPGALATAPQEGAYQPRIDDPSHLPRELRGRSRT